MRLFNKITTLFVGLTMALGVGLIADRGNKVEKAEAATTYNVTMKKASADTNGNVPFGDGALAVGTEKNHIAVTNTGSASLSFEYYKNQSGTTSIMNNGSQQIRLYGLTGNADADGGEIKVTINEGYIITGYTVNYTVANSAVLWTDGNAAGVLAASANKTVNGLSMSSIRFIARGFNGTSAGQIQLGSTTTYAFELTYQETVSKTPQEVADEFMAKVDALDGNVTLESGAAISALEGEYSGLDEETCALVDAAGYATKIARIKADFNVLVQEANQIAAQAVIDLIEALPQTITLADVSAVKAAEGAYEALTPEARDLIDSSYITILNNAVEAVRELVKQGTLSHTISGGNLSTTEYANGDWEGLINGGVAAQIYLSDTSHYLMNEKAFIDSNKHQIITDETITVTLSIGRYSGAAGTFTPRITFAFIDAEGNVVVSETAEYTGFSNTDLTTKTLEISLVGADVEQITGIKVSLADAGSVGTGRLRFNRVSLNYTYYEVELGKNVMSVSLDPATLPLQLGQTKLVTVNILPADADDLTYDVVSSDPSVATVTNGDGEFSVTAVDLGTATITVTTTDGGKIATCAVTVTEVAPIVHEFRTTLPAGTHNVVTLGGAEFSLLVSKNHTARLYDSTKGAQIGAKGTSGSVIFASYGMLYASKLTRIDVNASIASEANTSLKVMIGDTQIGETIPLTTTATLYSFDIGSEYDGLVGSLRVIFEGNGFYIKSLKVAGDLDGADLTVSEDVKFLIDWVIAMDTCTEYNDIGEVEEYYNEMTDEEKLVFDNALYLLDDEDVRTVLEKYEYMLALNAAEVSGNPEGLHPLMEIIDNNGKAFTALLIVSIIGLTSIIGYYLVLKKKYIA